MKKQTKQLLWILSILLLSIIATGALTDYVDITTLFSIDNGAISLATVTAAAATETNIGTVLDQKAPGSVDSQDINKPDISKKVAKIASSRFPLDTILREIESIKNEGFEHKHYAVRERGSVDKVRNTVTEAADGDLTAAIAVDNIHIWSLDSLILVPGINVANDGTTSVVASGAISFNPLVLNIVAIDRAAKNLIVYAVNAKRVPAMAIGTVFSRLGVAKDENAAISEDPSQMPYDSANYCQIHMTTISEGYYQSLQKKDVQWGFTDYKEQAMFDFRKTNEATSLFGCKGKFVDPITQKTKYTSDGIVRQINKHLDRGSKTSIDTDMLNGWCTDIFRGNNGSDERIAFYGQEFGRELAKATTVQKQLEAGKTKVVMGITFNRIETNDGVLLLKAHDLLTEMGYGSACVVLDTNAMYRAVQKPMEATPLDLDKTGISRSRSLRIDESHCTVTTNPEVHALITL